MSNSATITPFDFRSDFAAPDPSAAGPERISISIAELAALLDDTRRSTAEAIRNEQVEAQNAAIAQTTEQLKSALAQIIRLAETIENIDFSEDDRASVTGQVCKIASEIIDGQGNLFQS